MFDSIPMVWVAKGDDELWKWCVGNQCGGNPLFISTASFKTAKYARQNAEIVLQGRNIPYVLAPQTCVNGDN